jgi:hypothetical protein
MKRLILLVAFAVASYGWVIAQGQPFRIAIEAVQIEALAGIQSYAFGQADGKWLIVGGRLDGLHRRQPWAAFDEAGHNTRLFVVDPTARQVWTAGLDALPTPIAEQLSATNMAFHQDGDQLYCVGGYGYSATVGNHTTHDKLTVIDVPRVIDAVIDGEPYAPYFRQIADPDLQVTGGKLKKIYDTFYLLGGQKFLGRYNPMGPNHGPGFVQEYTNSIRRFRLVDDGTALTLVKQPAHTDAVNLHRRDYNAEAQILPNGEEGITMFSGVFRPDADLPFLDAVDVDSSGYTVQADFQQRYNHYHCPVLPIYSAEANEMHSVFFGGIAQFYEADGALVQDDNVPFVKTIARVTRDAAGQLTEYKLPVEMPTLLGAGAEFIPDLRHPHYANRVFKLDELPNDTTLLGHIFGGISSSALNIFFINNGTQSVASPTVFRVYLIKDQASATQDERSGATGFDLQLYPNPSSGTVTLTYQLPERGRVELTVRDLAGRILQTQIFSNQPVGPHTATLRTDRFPPNGVYLLTLRVGKAEVTKRLVLRG